MNWLLPVVAGFALGTLHAFDVDHLTAVTAFASRSPNARAAARFGLFWGLGHTTTLVVLGLATVAFKFVIPAAVEHAAELLVGILLIAIGGWTLKEVLQRRNIHFHRHEHDGMVHAHFHVHPHAANHSHTEGHSHHHSMFAIGATHGLAGTASVMVIIPMTIVQSVWTAGAFLFLFGLGTILAMSVFAYTLGSVTRRIGAQGRQLQWFRAAAGVVSLILGVIWIVQRI